jgi:membrane-associated phospholipid phosphatase
VLLLLGCAIVLVGVMAGSGYLDVHVLAHSRIGHLDGSVDQNLSHHRTGWLNAVTLGATDAASTYVVTGLALVAFITARLVFKKWREPLFVACAVGGEVAIFVATTLLVHRPRPNVTHLDQAPPTSSFPSGHTAATVALWGAIAVLVVRYATHIAWRRIALAAAIVLPIVVACSRLYRGMHFPTDVLGGALLGFAWLQATTRLFFSAVTDRAVAVKHAFVSGPPKAVAHKVSH